MKKVLFFILAVFAAIQSFAVTLTPYIHPVSGGMDSKEINLMLARLKSTLTQTSIQPGKTNNRFVISAKVDVVDKEFTPTTPVMTAVRLEVTIGVGDRIDGKCYSSHVITVKGVGDTEQKARMAAIKSVKVNSPELKAVVEAGAQKVFDYYEQNGEMILKDADNLIKAKPNDEASYQQALTLLLDCPTDCKFYDRFSEKVTSIYAAWVNHEAKRLYTWSKAKWAGDQSAENAMVVMDSLSVIESEATCYNDALALMDEVKKKLADDEAHAKKMEEMELRHQQDMERSKMQHQQEMQRQKMANDHESNMKLAGAIETFAGKWKGGSFISLF